MPTRDWSRLVWTGCLRRPRITQVSNSHLVRLRNACLSEARHVPSKRFESVTCSGIPQPKPFTDVPPESWNGVPSQLETTSFMKPIHSTRPIVPSPMNKSFAAPKFQAFGTCPKQRPAKTKSVCCHPYSIKHRKLMPLLTQVQTRPHYTLTRRNSQDKNRKGKKRTREQEKESRREAKWSITVAHVLKTHAYVPTEAAFVS